MADDCIENITHPPDSVSRLPSPCLHQVLSLLAPADLVRAVSCSKLLHAVGTTDQLWQAHCVARAWGPFQDVSWYKGYCWESSRLCVECRGPTRYNFKLLDCRLCEKCEFEHPKYSLVTTHEATERYGLTGPQLALIDSFPFHTTRLYLRSAVIHVAGGATGALASGAGASVDNLANSRFTGYPAGAEEDAQAEVDVGAMFLYSEEEAEEEGRPPAEQQQELSARGGEDTAAAEAAGGRKGLAQDAADRKAAGKAARKAHKKQVKEHQRQKRAMKAVPLSCSPLPGSTPPATNVLWTHPRLTSPLPPSNGSSPQISTFVMPASPQDTSGFLTASSPHSNGSSFLLASSAASYGFHVGATPPGGGFLTGGTPPSSSFLGAVGLSSGKKSKGPRQKTPRSSKVWTEDRSHMVSRRKEVSGWLAERQQLMAEWGEYSMSGLVLAT